MVSSRAKISAAISLAEAGSEDPCTADPAHPSRNGGNQHRTRTIGAICLESPGARARDDLRTWNAGIPASHTGNIGTDSSAA